MEPVHFSSFNLGVAITLISVFIALRSFSLDTKFNLRFKLRKTLEEISNLLFILSILLTFLAEFINIFDPFILQITAAFSILIAIALYSFIIFSPIKKISKYNVKAFTGSLNRFLIQRNQNELLKHFEDITYFYNSLLEYSIKDKNSRLIFHQYFTSNIFLTLFSEHIFLFEKTIHFYIKKQKELPDDDLYHISNFIDDLFVKSLNNENSFLNSFLSEDIYPNSLSYLDDLFTKETNINYSRFLFNNIRFSTLGIEGKISYMRMVRHYFKIIHRFNLSRKNLEGYEKIMDYNDQLIKIFFRDIKSFFESEFDQNNLKLLLDGLSNISWDYCWAVRTNDKSKELREITGIFLYDILESIISKYEIENEDIFRIHLIELFNKYIETQENSANTNIAYNAFIKKLKEKIIGDEWGANYKGYYPAVIKFYFYIFGFQLFSNNDDYEKENLNLPILLKLKESLPRLYTGFKQEFYDSLSLPKGKEEKLKKEGRKIIDDFLPKNINYDYDDNSLTYYYSGNNYGSKIILNKIENNNIVIDKV